MCKCWLIAHVKGKTYLNWPCDQMGLKSWPFESGDQWVGKPRAIWFNMNQLDQGSTAIVRIFLSL